MTKIRDLSMLGDFPDLIILHPTVNPLESLAVNWRTSVDQPKGKVEWAEATHGAEFMEFRKVEDAESSFLSVRHETNPTVEAYYHAAVISDLIAGKTYVYRVGSEEHWSE